jgi:hypothetical protein
MNRRNYLHSAVILFTASLWALATSSASAEIVTFQLQGHLVLNSALPDLVLGDKLTITYSFDTSVQPHSLTPDNTSAQYTAMTAWEIDFDKGYRFIAPSSTETFINDIYLYNNAVTPSYPYALDTYLVTFNNPVSVGVPLPSGHTFSFFDIDIQDDTPDGHPDFLNDVSLHSTPPNWTSAASTFGDIYIVNDQGTYYTIDSFTVVPEPATAILAIFGLGLLLASKVQRVGGFAVC